MRTLYRFVMRLLVTAIVLLAVSGISYSQTTWTDSLNVRVADSTVIRSAGKAYLQFAVVVERTNAVWNNQDTVMGDCDLYFDYIPDAFVGGPQLTWINENLFTAPNINTSARLQISTKIWAERLFIDISKRDDKFNIYTKEFKFVQSKVDTICKIRWELKTVTGAHGDAALPAKLGVVWDPEATGLQSWGGNPIIENLQGAIPVPPGANIFLDWENLPMACEGESLEVGVYAYTSGEGLKFTWSDSIPGVSGWTQIVEGDAPTGLQSHTHGGRHSFEYALRGKGDTLFIKKVTGQMDSIYFRCQAYDASLMMSKVTVPPMQLIVHHNLKGFLSKLGGTLTPNLVDTVSKCLDNEVDIQFNVYGMAEKEFEAVDSVFFLYYWWPTPAVPKWDTIGFSLKDSYDSRSEKINGHDVYFWTHKVKDSGQYYIGKIWTKYCENSFPDPVYDTIYIKEGSFQQLKRLTVLVGEWIVADTLDKLPGGNPGSGNIWNMNPDLGTISNMSSSRLRYTAKQIAGLDTIVYRYPTTDGQGCSWIYREIEVQNFKYVGIKVLLEGPYISGTNPPKMRSLLTTTNLNNTLFGVSSNSADPDYYGFPKNQAGSYFMPPPYYNSKDSIRVNQLRALAAKVEATGAEICDWIEIRLRKVEASGEAGDYVASKSVFLMNNGTVCDTAGNPYIKFEKLNNTKYFVVIKHRNHLSVRSKNPITLSNSVPAHTVPNWQAGWSSFVDLTDINNIYDNILLGNLRPGPTTAIGGIEMMWCGDFNEDQRVTTADVSQAVDARKNVRKMSMSGYYIEDINFDTRVTTADDNKIRFNRKKNIVSHAK